MITENPQRSVIAIQAPAKPIIEPIDKSNSPAIIKSPAPRAIIPSWEITRRLFLMPRALNPSPAKGFQVVSAAGIEKYPSIPNNRNMTPIGPISGLETIVRNPPLDLCRSDSCLPNFAVMIIL